ncbi:MAG: type II secretion system F family protein, partial [Betaproteobacteria bacterium]|nr:type II secretion system F family protein [Betaproteobacteria bacterium]
QELLALLEAGLNLFDALETLAEKERDADCRAVLARLLTSLGEGKRFSDALEVEPRVFPDLFVATVRASERSGGLTSALSRYVAYAQTFDALKKKLLSACIYPVALMIVGGLVTLFLLGYVVPRFASVYEATGRDIPWLSVLLLAVGRAMHQLWPLVFGLIGAIVLFAGTLVTNPAMRNRVLTTGLRLPLLKQIAFEFRLTRFYRTLALLLNAGVPLAKSIAMTRELFVGAERGRLDAVKRAIEEGRTFSESLEAEGMVTAVALRLMRVGEQSGELSQMLERTAKFHDEDLGRRIDWVARLAEPILMTIMGLVIGVVVVLLYLPIFDLAASIQ